jgi:hypothetical protein
MAILKRLRVQEVKSMSLKVYHVHYRACHVRSNVFLDVKGCLNAVFGGMLGHGKSPCFLRCRVLKVLDLEWIVLNFFMVNGVNFFE